MHTNSNLWEKLHDLENLLEELRQVSFSGLSKDDYSKYLDIESDIQDKISEIYDSIYNSN